MQDEDDDQRPEPDEIDTFGPVPDEDTSAPRGPLSLAATELTVRLIREQVAWIETNPVSEELENLAYFFRDLDQSISAGGPLPAAWQPARPDTARYDKARARVTHCQRLITEYHASEDYSAADDVRHYDYLDAVESETYEAERLIAALSGVETIPSVPCTCPSCIEAAQRSTDDEES